MEGLIVYLAKASGLVCTFFIAYYFLLRKETFFTANRKFLIAGLLTAALLPLIKFTHTVWVDPLPESTGYIITDKAAVLSGNATLQTDHDIDWGNLLIWVYISGVLFFTVKFITEVISLYKLLNSGTVIRKDGFKLIDTKVAAPFSFLNYIVFDAVNLNKTELENVLAHEKVHSRQWHTLDMITGQLFCIFLWFNPFIWLYKKAITQNLEFIADADASKKVQDIRLYQKTLLKVTVQPQRIEIINHFYQSLIKKRIIMLNKKQSKKIRLWKYAVALPVITAFVLLLQVETTAQVRPQTSNFIASDPGSAVSYPVVVVMDVNKNITDKEMNEKKALYKNTFDADVAFDNIKRNNKGEITAITIRVKDKDNQTSYPVREVIMDNNQGIAPFTMGIEKVSAESKNDIFFGKAAQKIVYVGDDNTNDITYNENTEAPSAAQKYITERMNGRDVLLVINGKIQEGGKLKLLQNEKITTMSEIDAESTYKKYGVSAKDGAIEIATVPVKEDYKRTVYKNKEKISKKSE